MNKQELENRIKDLESDIQASQNTIEELKKAIGNIEEKSWKPKEEEIYYGVEGLRVVSSHNNGQFDKDMMRIGNYFKTKEQAERALFEQNLRSKLRKFAEDNNDKIDWSDDDSWKYCIVYEYNYNKITTCVRYGIADFSQIYFSSKETVEKAIEQFHDELMKYFTEQ
ncbi:hypothetical protein AB2T90_11350 [Clostridium butyricum]|uniref:hypothetical protein n=1 Tax=Clostridium butyricum TaxID=1492 RepID=UPI003465AFAB